jgi:hypothetical protein
VMRKVVKKNGNEDRGEHEDEEELGKKRVSHEAIDCCHEGEGLVDKSA